MKKKLALTAVLMLILVALSTSGVFAYQSTPNGTPTSAAAAAWMSGIRQMESAGRGMGLSETVNTSNGLATSASNNIDVHLQKNTEYGAIVLLGASDYGKQGTGQARYMGKGTMSRTGMSGLATSTGNASGIYELGYDDINTGKSTNYEWTAGGGTSFLSAFDRKYRDIYKTSGVGKPGDATVENGVNISSWQSGHSYFATGSYGFRRGISGSAFYANNNNASGSYYARAVVVCGSGL